VWRTSLSVSARLGVGGGRPPSTESRASGARGEAEPLFVVRVEPETARVIVGPKQALLQSAFALHGLNWLGAGEGPLADGLGVTMKLRNTQVPVAGTVFAGDDGAQVVLEAPEAAITPGQACVFYDGGRVLGGGWIARGPGGDAALPHNRRHETRNAAFAAQPHL